MFCASFDIKAQRSEVKCPRASSLWSETALKVTAQHVSKESHPVPSEQSPAEQVSRQAELRGPVSLLEGGEVHEQLRPAAAARLLSAGRAAALRGRVSTAAPAIHSCSPRLSACFGSGKVYSSLRSSADLSSSTVWYFGRRLP